MNRRFKILSQILFVLLYSTFINGQNLKILKDSVFIDNSYFKLQELKITSKNNEANNKIYIIIQNTYPIFDKPFFGSPEQRIKVKKDTISKYVLENSLRESNVGFEDYKIYYDKNNIINISIGIQSYGSSWEGIQYYCFDLNNGKKIGLNLFVNQQSFLKVCKNKFKLENKNLYIKLNDLINFKIITDKNKNLIGIDFSVFDYKNYKNSGYQEYIIHFDSKEIEKYISPLYKKRFLQK